MFEFTTSVKCVCMKVTPRIAAEHAAQLGHKLKPRGRAFAKGNQWGFKKGQSGNPGGKSRVLQRFGTRIAEELVQPAPEPLRRWYKLPKGATKFDVMMAAAVAQAMDGDLTAFVALRETCEGKLPSKNFNISASMERFLEDPKFREFLEQSHGEFLQQQGVLENGTEHLGIPANSPLRKILGTSGDEEA